MKRPNTGRTLSIVYFTKGDWLFLGVRGNSYEKECQALQKDSKAYWDAMRGKLAFARLFLVVDLNAIFPSHDFITGANRRDARNVLWCCGWVIRRCYGRPRLQAICWRVGFKLYKRTGTKIPSPFSFWLEILTHFTPAQDAPFRTTISEPLGKMCAYFPVVNEHIAKRNKKVGNRISSC